MNANLEIQGKVTLRRIIDGIVLRIEMRRNEANGKDETLIKLVVDQAMREKSNVTFRGVGLEFKLWGLNDDESLEHKSGAYMFISAEWIRKGTSTELESVIRNSPVRFDMLINNGELKLIYASIRYDISKIKTCIEAKVEYDSFRKLGTGGIIETKTVSPKKMTNRHQKELDLGCGLEIYKKIPIKTIEIGFAEKEIVLYTLQSPWDERELLGLVQEVLKTGKVKYGFTLYKRAIGNEVKRKIKVEMLKPERGFTRDTLRLILEDESNQTHYERLDSDSLEERIDGDVKGIEFRLTEPTKGIKALQTFYKGKY